MGVCMPACVRACVRVDVETAVFCSMCPLGCYRSVERECDNAVGRHLL